jgi:hypothetical protein
MVAFPPRIEQITEPFAEPFAGPSLILVPHIFDYSQRCTQSTFGSTRFNVCAFFSLHSQRKAVVGL